MLFGGIILIQSEASRRLWGLMHLGGTAKTARLTLRANVRLAIIEVNKFPFQRFQ